jgi:hypothetical protein
MELRRRLPSLIPYRVSYRPNKLLHHILTVLHTKLCFELASPPANLDCGTNMALVCIGADTH